MTNSPTSYFHRGGLEPLLGASIPQHFASVVEQFPHQEAVVSIPQKRRLSYKQLAVAVDMMARGLLSMKYKKGDRIGIWSTNNIEWLIVQMASARIGAVLVNINPAYRARELAYALQRSRVNGLFLIPSFRSSNYIAMLVELIPQLKTRTAGNWRSDDFPALRQIIVFDPAAPANTQRPYTGFHVWQEVLAAAEQVAYSQLTACTAQLDRDDPINIQYTSGTTGFPKAVVLTHHNILNNAYFTAHAMHFKETDRLAVAVPFYHCFGMVLANLLCLSVGACIVIACDHFDALSVLQAVEQEQCTAIHGVPTMFIVQLEHPQFKQFDLSSLRTGIMAGAPCPPELMNLVMEDMHCHEILIGYGQTEASPITHLTTRDDTLARRTQTVGRNLPHQEVKVIDIDSGHTLPLGEVGEICFRGYHIMMGYFGDEDSSQAAIDGHSWLHSGDLGTMDAEGYVKITGRLKEMIIRGGENIYPREIEDFLFTHPKVAQACVFGIPDEKYGEEVMAWVKLHTGDSLTEGELQAYCKGQIAHFKIPKHIWFVDEFPMTVTGKLQKFRIREIVIRGLKENAIQVRSP